jgi:hypothetical protein
MYATKPGLHLTDIGPPHHRGHLSDATQPNGVAQVEADTHHTERGAPSRRAQTNEDPLAGRLRVCLEQLMSHEIQLTSSERRTIIDGVRDSTGHDLVRQEDGGPLPEVIEMRSHDIDIAIRVRRRP